ncbi:MAG: ROK family transcriptional regulator [Lachnospiraceae bacterium]|nr:ROK family transcriptional regulator [Lachnospiraceae bacterium]
MKDGINSKVMKSQNSLLVLKTIMRKAPISRSELTRQVGLTQASVINVTNLLLEAGVLIEVGQSSEKKQGRRSLVLDIKEDAFYNIGVELSVGKLECGIANARGTLIGFEEQYFPSNSGAEELVEQIGLMVRKFLTGLQIDKESVLGLGLAVPGPLDVENGVMVAPPNFPNLKNAPLQKMLEEKLGFRVCIDKETNLAALAESFYGASVGYKTSFFLSLFHLGISGGLISENNIFHGFRDGAGEIGHISVETAGRKCSCGNYGCLEAMIADDYILECVCHDYKIGLETECVEGIESLTLEEVFRRSREGDPVCEKAVKQTAAYIAMAVGNIINIFSPEMIVLGGDLPEMSDQLVEMVAERVHRRPYPSHCGEVKLVRSSLGPQVYVKGAAALVLEKFLVYALPG